MFTEQQARLSGLIASAEKADTIAKHEVSMIQGNVSTLAAEQKSLRESVELLRMASVILQKLVDDIAVANIRKVEELVNAALYSIFNDQSISFNINQSVKRGQVLYQLSVSQNGAEGGVNSFGGGVMSVIAVVLKAVILILSKRYPLLVFDESLAFVSAEYREAVSKFLCDLTKPSPNGLGLPVLMVTHDPEYSSHADQVYQAHSIEGGISFKKK